MTILELSKKSKVSYSTLLKIANEKFDFVNVSSSIKRKISEALNIELNKLSMMLSYDDLSLFSSDDEFDLFKSHICHELKYLNYKKFLIKYLKEDSVFEYYQNKQYLESIYLLSMIDYLCESHNLPLVKDYDEIRQYKFDKVYIPKSLYYQLLTRTIKISDIYQEFISTFLSHNIVEAEIEKVA